MIASTAAILGLATFALRKHRLAEHRQALESEPAMATPIDSVAPGASDIAAPIPTAMNSSPRDAAAAWQGRAGRAKLALHTARYGPRAALAETRPPMQAWADLNALADGGDIGAATAAILLAAECRSLRDFRKEMAGRAHVNVYARDASSFPDAWREFVAAADSQQYEALTRRIDDCQNVDGGVDLALLLMDRFWKGDSAGVRRFEAGEMKDDDAAIATLRDLLRDDASPSSQRDLAIRLLESRSAADQAEGLALLQTLFEHGGDAQSLFDLAHCLRLGCWAFRGDIAAIHPWQQFAAGWGDFLALRGQIEDLEKDRASVDALSWALYRLALAQGACFEAPPPLIALVDAAKEVFRLQKTLSSEEQNTATARYREIWKNWHSRAAIEQSCAF